MFKIVELSKGRLMTAAHASLTLPEDNPKSKDGIYGKSSIARKPILFLPDNSSKSLADSSFTQASRRDSAAVSCNLFVVHLHVCQAGATQDMSSLWIMLSRAS